MQNKLFGHRPFDPIFLPNPYGTFSNCMLNFDDSNGVTAQPNHHPSTTYPNPVCSNIISLRTRACRSIWPGNMIGGERDTKMEV